jgi:hypothetical protein
MKARIYQFLILLLQTLCGGLVVEKEWNFITEFMFIILPFSVLGAILFTLYEREIKEQ